MSCTRENHFTAFSLLYIHFFTGWLNKQATRISAYSAILYLIKSRIKYFSFLLLIPHYLYTLPGAHHSKEL